MRELRFRAWHEKLGRMFDDVCVDSNGTELLDDKGDWQTGWKKLAGDNYTDIGKDNAKSGLIIGNLLENPELFNVPSEKGE